MANIDDRLAALERRIGLLEDQVAIYQLMAAYGPAADSGSTERATSLWAEDGVYDLHARVMTGRDELARSERGWQVKRRISRRLDGSQESHALLASGVGADRG